MNEKRLAGLILWVLLILLVGGCQPAEGETLPEATQGAFLPGDKALATVFLTPDPASETPEDAASPTGSTADEGLPYPTVVVTPEPTASPTFPLTLIPTLAGGPLTVAGCTVPYPYAYAWSASQETQSKLGCPSGLPSSQTGAAQRFERGFMFWRASDRRILVVTDEGRWALIVDSFTEGQLEEDPGINPPAGLFEPVRGFGKIWRENEDIREALGWALEQEYFASLGWLDFEGGYVVSDPAVQDFYALIRENGADEGVHGGAASG